jgi:hypothetical protein
MNNSFIFEISSVIFNCSYSDTAVILNILQIEQLCSHFYNNVYLKANFLLQGLTDPFQDIATMSCGETGSG